MIRQHVAVYSRRSSDPSDLAISVNVQKTNGERYATTKWPKLPTIHYIDNGLTAADPDVTRPEYLRLLDAIRAGQVAHLVTREQSRLTRQPSEWEQLCTILQVARIDNVHTTNGGLISVAEGSRIAGRIMAVVDAEYVEQLRVRIKASHTALAEEGRPPGSTSYGYERYIGADGRPALRPHPVQAPIVARLVKEVAEGWSLRSIAQSLNDEGIPTSRGAAEWHPNTVRTLIRSPRIVGDRVHRGEVVGPGNWEPIVDRTLWLKAIEALTARSVIDLHGRIQPIKRTKSATRRYLLSGGLAVCGACDGVLTSGRQGTRNKGYAPAYTCPHPSLGRGTCGSMSVKADRFEAEVTRRVSKWLESESAAKQLNRHLNRTQGDAAPLRSELDEIDAKLGAAAERWASGELLELEYAAMRRVLLDRRSKILGELAELQPHETVSAAELREAWNLASDVVDRRDVLAAVIKPVRLLPALDENRRRVTIERRALIRPIWE